MPYSCLVNFDSMKIHILNVELLNSVIQLGFKIACSTLLWKSINLSWCLSSVLTCSDSYLRCSEPNCCLYRSLIRVFTVLRMATVRILRIVCISSKASTVSLNMLSGYSYIQYQLDISDSIPCTHIDIRKKLMSCRVHKSIQL